MEWVLCLYGRDVEIILWGRGMSTHVVLDYCAFLSKSSYDINKNLRFIVLDTPFESIKQMVEKCMEKLHIDGYHLPHAAIAIFSRLARRIIARQLGGEDVYEIESLKLAARVEKPCYVIAAMDDDYIPLEQCMRIAEGMSGPCAFHSFRGGHFGRRPLDVTNPVGQAIERCLQSPSTTTH